MRRGPLTDLKVIEFSGIGPAPFCGMLLSDLGAEVLRIDRPGGPDHKNYDVTRRGRRSVAMQLKSPEAIATCLHLIERADVLLEGFRPGVMERLGLGPDVALGRNRALVYGRMTGWGQTGPLASTAGHDLNYISIAGALHAIGGADRPVPPLNLVGDFGGGALYLAFGVMAGVHSARLTGHGQVVDCAMSDGVASLMAYMYGAVAEDQWVDAREANLLDGAAPFYRTYACSDGKWVAVAALEPRFYAILRARLDLSDSFFDHQDDRALWPRQAEAIARIFASQPRDHWSRVFDGTDACFSPVLSIAEAPGHPHNIARGAFVEIDGIAQPAPAPRFSRTPGQVQSSTPQAGADNQAALADWGVAAKEIARLRELGALQA